jgi:hypothetical protein
MKARLFNRRTRQLAKRKWTDRERHVVWRGLTGRMAIAIEPLLGIAFMIFLEWGIIYRAQHVPADHDLIVFAWVMPIGIVAFLGYFIGVLFAPVSAFLQTYRPIYIIDGYLRYRGPDENSEIDGAGYIATLFEDATLACEWECYGKQKLPERTIPALVEFSPYGIHKIDGRPTGLIPDKVPVLAIGIAPRKGTYPDD